MRVHSRGEDAVLARLGNPFNFQYRLWVLSSKVTIFKARTMMDMMPKKRRFVTTKWLALLIAVLFGSFLCAGCATDSASRSNYSDSGQSHAGHNH